MVSNLKAEIEALVTSQPSKLDRSMDIIELAYQPTMEQRVFMQRKQNPIGGSS